MVERAMSVLDHDVARFNMDDPEVLVAATFACPMCLRAPCRVVLDDGDVLPVATCACTACAHEWVVELEARQLLRLSLDPPATVWLSWGRQARHLQGLFEYEGEDLDD
jgi:hypothetical protein